MASVSYGNNFFKVGCCQLQSHLGLKLTSRSPQGHAYQGFEGYYCPSKIARTGAAVYTKTNISSLGNPGPSGGATNSVLLKLLLQDVPCRCPAIELWSGGATWTLSWDKFRDSWNLKEGEHLHVPQPCQTELIFFPFWMSQVTFCILGKRTASPRLCSPLTPGLSSFCGGINSE